MRRLEWLGLAAVSLALAGSYAGYHVGYRVAMAHSWLGAISVARIVADRADIVYSEGNLEAAREAGESYLDFLTQVEQRGGGETLDLFRLDERGFAFDKMLTLARLALIAERD